MPLDAGASIVRSAGLGSAILLVTPEWGTCQPKPWWPNSRGMAQMFLALYRFPKPIVAAVNGAAIAGGCGLATLCDLTVAAAEAKFGYTEVRIGFLPAVVSVFLVRQVGEKRARDLLLTGRVF